MTWRPPAVGRFALAAVLAPLACLAGVGLVVLFGTSMFFVVVLGLIPAVAIGVAWPRFEPQDIGIGIAGTAIGSLLLISLPVLVVEGPERLGTAIFVAMLYTWPGLVMVAAPAMLVASALARVTRRTAGDTAP